MFKRVTDFVLIGVIVVLGIVCARLVFANGDLRTKIASLERDSTGSEAITRSCMASLELAGRTGDRCTQSLVSAEVVISSMDARLRSLASENAFYEKHCIPNGLRYRK